LCIQAVKRLKKKHSSVGMTEMQQRRLALIPALEIRNLIKQFDRPAVNGLDLSVPAGTFYALLGANGAGKTTTLRMAAGLMRPD
jgi:ABC-type uncharacterized transport system ATPase subunit